MIVIHCSYDIGSLVLSLLAFIIEGIIFTVSLGGIGDIMLIVVLP